MRALIVLLLAVGLPSQAAAADQPLSRFTTWGAAVIAADWRTSAGDPIQAFDNARRDLTAGFLKAGFARDNLVDYSLRPDLPRPVTADQALEGVGGVMGVGRTGCFLYFTSHGSPQGIVFGPDGLLSPQQMDELIGQWCGDRPTVVVVSACFSGVFIPVLAAPNRMIITAARRDRSSFGCSEDATHPYFDGCILESLPQSRHFIQLANLAKTCVTRRETEEGLRPASEPQVSIGADMQMLLPTLTFAP